MECQQGKAIVLVSFTKDEGFKITKEGTEFLLSIKEKVGVIAIAGRYRTGKSFLVNRIISDAKGKSTSFSVGPTINPCTKGLWVWNQTIDVEKSGEAMKVLVVDSEGTDSCCEDQNHDTKIFLLTVIISSLFIYNSVGAIDENSIQNLSLIINLCQQLHVKNKQNNDNDLEELKQYFPSFLWVLRDFALKLEDEGQNKISCKQYLENSLAFQKGNSDKIETKNRIRRLIKTLFLDRDCATLVRPVEDEKELQKLQSLDETHIRAEFVEQMTGLKSKIMKKVKPKSFNGQMLNGKMLLELLESFVTAINSGRIPTIENAWDYVCENQTRDVITDAMKLYEKAISNCPTDEDAIEEYHNKISKEIFKQFNDKAMGDSAKKYEDSLKEQMNTMLTQVKSKCQEQVKDTIIEKLDTVKQEFESKIRSGAYVTLVTIKEDIYKYKEQYLKEMPKHSEKEKLFQQTAAEILANATEYIIRESENKRNIEQAKTKDTIEKLQLETAKAKAELETVKASYEMKLTDEREKTNKANAENILLNGKIQLLESQINEFKVRSSEQVKLVAKDQLEKIDEYKSKCKQLENSIAELKSDSFKKECEIQKELMIAQQKLVFADQKYEECNSKLKIAETELVSANDKLVNIKIEKEKIKQEMDHKIKEKSKLSEEGELNNKKLKEELLQAKDMVEQMKEEVEKKTKEKDIIERELSYAKANMEETKKLHDTFKIALDKGIKAEQEPSLMEANKNLSAMLQKMEQRVQHLEKKNAILKEYHKLLKFSSSLQCKYCLRFYKSDVFNAHISVCTKEPPKISTAISMPIGIQISQTLIKEDTDGKPFTEYAIHVQYNGKKWSVNRKYKLFSSLNEKLMKEYMNVKFPESSNQFLSIALKDNNSKVKTVEERRKQLQQYIMDLALIPSVKESITFKKFLGIDLVFPEECDGMIKFEEIFTNPN